MALRDLLHGLREVRNRQGVILDHEHMRAVREVEEALPVSLPGIGWDGGVLGYLHVERGESLQ